MSTTIADIAKRIGVTKSTVSRVLNSKSTIVPVSEATRQRILEAARTMDYRPSFAAKSLANGRTYSIGFQCGNIRSAYYGELAEIAMAVAEEYGYHLTIQVTPWRASRNDLDCLETLLRRGVDGVVFFGSALKQGEPLYEDMVDRRFPIVTVNSRTPDLPWVASDHRSGMLETVGYLRQRGHRRIAYVDLCSESVSAKRRAFVDACADERVQPEFVETASIEKSDARDAGRRFAESADRPSAVIAMSDQVAIGFMCGLFDAGLDVPSDVAVVGIDGTEAGEYYRPKLTTIAQDRESLMRHAVKNVIEMIEHKGGAIENVSIPTKLIIRASA